MQSRSTSTHFLKSRRTGRAAAGSAATTTAGSATATSSNHASQQQDRELALVKNISDRLETGLNEYALKAIMELLQRGEHPDAIVAAVTSLSQRAGS